MGNENLQKMLDFINIYYNINFIKIIYINRLFHFYLEKYLILYNNFIISDIIFTIIMLIG